MFEYRKPVRVSATTIDCEINHPRLGWVPYSASQDDVEDSCRAIYEFILEDHRNGTIIIQEE